MSPEDRASIAAEAIAEAVADVNEGEPLTALEWPYVARKALEALDEMEAAS